jgi:hypothetical protein
VAQDIIADGLTWLRDQLEAHCSQLVVYCRGSYRLAIYATFGRKLLRLSDEAGGGIGFSDRDFLIGADVLKDEGGRPLTPVAGDVIRQYVGHEVLVFEVLPVGGEPEANDASRGHGLMWRCHTKFVATEST